MPDVFDTLDAPAKTDIFDEVAGQPSQSAAQKLRSPASNPRPLAGKIADLVSGAIGDEEGFGIAGWTKALSNPVLQIAKGAGVVAPGQESKPLIPIAPVPDNPDHPIVQGAADFVGNVISSLSTPEVMSQLALGGLGKNAAKVVGAGFLSQMAVDAPHQAAEVGTKLAQGDKRGATTALLNYALETVGPGEMARENIPIGAADKARVLSSELRRAPLEPSPFVTTPLRENATAAERLQNAPAFIVQPSSEARPAEIITPSTKEAAPDLAKPPTEGGQNASGIREDTGRTGGAGEAVQGGASGGGGDIQQPPPGTPAPTGEEASKEKVTPTPEAKAGEAKESPGQLLVRYGESHRQHDKQMRAFQDAGIPLRGVGAATLGSKALHGIIPDTAEARELAKKMGMTIARKQWPHLKPEAKPVETPPAAESKMQQAVEQAPVKPTSEKPTQNEVKSELVYRLEKHIADAPETSEELKKAIAGGLNDVKKADNFKQRRAAYERIGDAYKKAGVKKITIDIPGDGVFDVWNSKEALGETLKRAKRLETSSTEPPKVSRSGISKADKKAAEKILANPQKAPEVTSMGGLAPGDPNEPVGKNQPPETGGYGGDIYGVAQRVRESRAQSGQVAPVASGEGIDAESAVNWGRELIRNGVNAEKVLSDFEKTKQISFDGIAVLRAKGEELSKAARNIEQEFGTNSDEYKMAFDALSKWDARTKAVQTEWHKIGMAQQGETDIDTGTFTGLQRAFKADSGKDFTPSQAEQAQKIADRNKKADEAESEAKRKLYETAQNQGVEPHIKSIVERILSFSHQQADAARARIKARAFTFSAGVDPTVLADIAIIGADHILTGATDFAAWSKRMIDEFGEKIGPHLNEIFKASDAKADEITKGIAGKQEPEVKKARASKGPQTTEEIKATLANHKPGAPFSPEQVKGLWNQAKIYIDQGNDHYGEIRNKIATDLGMSVEEVNRGLTQSKPVKRLADDVWRKQQTARLLKQHAKQWLKEAQFPGYRKALNALPRLAFGAKVFGHGFVALGTHAPMVAFQPKFWPEYLRDFGKMYKMVGSTAFNEMEMSDLMRRKNYTVARRAGLVNDPMSYEDFNNPNMGATFGGITRAGNRGYSVLKILRQDMFDKQWDALPESAQLPEVAQAIADGVNHATGVTKSRALPGAHIIAFAPRLEFSRGAWLFVDPVKAANTLLDWKNASIGDKHFAINQIKEKATVAATFFSLLAANQALLSATGSKQKVNMTDPMKGDFMKFKVAGMQLSYGNPMITMVRLPVRLWRIRESDGGKLKNLIYPDESSYTVMGEYARSQLSPFSSLVADLWLKSDWMNRPLPNSNRPVPKRLRAEGVKPYTWKEFGFETVLPIPGEEAAREVFKVGFGLDKKQQDEYIKALFTISVMTATGARLNDDWEVSENK